VSQTQRLFLASPNTGSGAPDFRAIMVTDLPDLSGQYQGQSNVLADLALGSAKISFSTSSLFRRTYTLPNVNAAILTDATPVTVSQGGTGQTTLALARNAMGLGNTTGALPIANGGTSATTAATARTNLGLGTAATYNVPTSGDAAANQVVLGNDSRLTSGPAVVQQNLSVTGAQYDNVVLNSDTTLLYITTFGTGTVTVTGFTGGVNGRELIIIYAGSLSFTFMNNHSGSSVGNRLRFTANTDKPQNPITILRLIYSSSVNFWLEA
jgi:hypothetical protein